MTMRWSPWARFAHRPSAGARAHGMDLDAAPLRRVGRRLAALTVGLLCALLLALGLTIYFSTRTVLLGSLQDIVKARATAVLVASPSLGSGPAQPRDGDGDGDGPPARPPDRPEQGNVDDGVVTTVANAHLGVLFSAPPISTTLADPAAARAALAGHLSSPYSTQQVDANGPYLIYTARGPVRSRDGTVATGVAQARISEQQYLDSLRHLLIILLEVSAAGLLASALISVVLAGRALQPIRAALRRQRDFVADAAHDGELRTPLAIMRGASELGLAAGTGPAQEAGLEQALAQNAHLTRLVEDISTLARRQRGRGPGARAARPVPARRRDGRGRGGPGRGPRRAVSGRDARRRACRRRRGPAAPGAVDLARQRAHVYARQWVDHGERGAARRARAAAGGDSGPGIAPEDLPHLFERFYRADKARGSMGSGLGLSIGRWIAEAHGGRLTAANAPGRGALFTVTLPLASP